MNPPYRTREDNKQRIIDLKETLKIFDKTEKEFGYQPGNNMPYAFILGEIRRIENDFIYNIQTFFYNLFNRQTIKNKGLSS